MNGIEPVPPSSMPGGARSCQIAPSLAGGHFQTRSEHLDWGGGITPPGRSLPAPMASIESTSASTGLPRHRLRDYLLSPDAPPLVVLHAPAGYGKTTLMAQAFEQCRDSGLSAAWLRLGAKDMSGALLASLASVLPDPPEKLSMEALAAAIEEYDKPVHLFVDDFQILRRDEAGPLLGPLIANSPQNLRVIIATRVRLPLNLAGLRVKQLVEILDARVLAFSDDELAALRATRLLPAPIDSLVRRAEGWPAIVAIALDAGAKTGQDGLPRAPLPLSLIAEYLDEEIFEQVPPEWRDMLLRVSILDVLTADVIDAVLGRLDGAQFLDWLSAHGLLAPDEDDPVGACRLNPLLRDHLAAQLARLDPAAVAALHGRAANFHLDRGAEIRAARHAIRSDDIVVIQRLFENTSILRLGFVGGGALLHMLKDVDLAIARGLPQLVLAEVYLLLMANQRLQASRLFEGLKQETQNFTLVPDIENAAFMAADALVIEMLIAGYADHLTVNMIEIAEHRLGEMPASDEILLLVLRQLKVWAHYWDGNFLHPDKLRDLLWCRPSGPDPSYVDLYGSFALGVCALERGDLDQAEAHHRHASDLAIRFGGSRGSQAKTARLLLADVAYERNQIERSRNLMEGLIEEVELGEGWFDLYAAAYLTGSSLAFQTSWESALAILDRGEATATRVELDRLRLLMNAQRLKLAVMAGEMELAGRQYDILERVGALDLLPEAGGGLGWRITIPSQLAAARFDLARHEPQKALNRLARMPVRREGHRQNRRLIEIHLLTAIAYDQLGKCDDAVAALDQALKLGAATGMERVFVNLDGMLSKPIDMLLRRRPHAGTEVMEFARRLRPLLAGRALPSFGDAAPGGGVREQPQLSERERDVLNVLATGKTYKEIAYDLQISINTVMTHRKKLYRKLGTSSRSKALSRARSMGLIP